MFNCWNPLKLSHHNVARKGERDGLKTRRMHNGEPWVRITPLAAKLLNRKARRRFNDYRVSEYTSSEAGLAGASGDVWKWHPPLNGDEDIVSTSGENPELRVKPQGHVERRKPTDMLEDTA